MDPKELRILVFGNSVVNGGNLTDQSRVGTTILQRALAKELGRPVVVGNITAGNWGPPNHLAYVKQYGLLDADILVFVWSSSDFDNAPTFQPLDPLLRPTQAPASALWEGITRYLPRYLNRPTTNEAGLIPDARQVSNKRDAEVTQSAEHELYEMAKTNSVKVMLIQHWTESELRAQAPLYGHADIRRIASQAGVPTFDDTEQLQTFLDAGKNPYRDDIHINDYGQQALAELLLATLKKEFPDVITH